MDVGGIPSRVAGRWPFLGFAALLLGLLWLSYHTSLKHVARADQWILLLDTIDHHGFLDLVAHSYSYSRTRVVYAGDTQLFRPLFFVLLAAERAAFGTDFRLWHATGVMLHFLACLLFLRVALRMQSLTAPKHTQAEEQGPWFAAYAPPRLIPYALTLFFALNYAVVEQVTWFNINGYILFVIFTLASILLLLDVVADAGLTPKQRAIRLGAAWLLTLLGAFTYELGQFYALLAGLFLAAVWWGRGQTRRGAALLAAFATVTLLYQTANWLDRWHHQGQFTDDVVPSDIIRRAFTVKSLEHWQRYPVFAIVQPFLPLNCKSKVLPMGKGVLWEQVWHGQLKINAALVLSLGVFGLWAGLTLLGLARLVAARQGTRLAVAAFPFAIAGLHMSLIVFGRMNLRPAPECLHLNHYYIYMTLLFILLGSAAAVPALQGQRGRRASWALNGAVGLLVAGLVVLGACGGLKAHEINAKAVRLFRPYRWMNDSLRRFVEEHRHEPDFSFAMLPQPFDHVPSVTGVPCPIILYKQYVNSDDPKYVVWFEKLHAVAVPAEEWRRSHPEFANALCPELVQVGAGFHVFRHREYYYALPYNTAINFVYARDRSDYPGALKDRSLEGLLRQVRGPRQAASGGTANRR